jgi:penicillin-binding protein activator
MVRQLVVALSALVALGSSSIACSNPTPVRGAEVEGLDDPAFSTGLDKRDLQKLMHENMSAFIDSPIVQEWIGAGTKPRIAIYPLANETSEHIDSQLDALLSDVESFLVNSNKVTVISVERQRQMMGEIGKQHGGGFDPTQVAEVNKQLGAEYYITGKVFTSDERMEGERRVQYFMFMQIIEVSTSAIRFQKKTELTKGLIDT